MGSRIDRSNRPAQCVNHFLSSCCESGWQKASGEQTSLETLSPHRLPPCFLRSPLGERYASGLLEWLGSASAFDTCYDHGGCVLPLRPITQASHNRPARGIAIRTQIKSMLIPPFLKPVRRNATE
jgi:hypothetical protein